MTTLMQHIKVPPKDGLKKTLEIMNYLEKLSFQNVDFVNFVFKNFSSNCAACIPGKIWKYMQNNFVYQSDDPFDEIITAPYILLKTKRGDCDDFSLFAKHVLIFSAALILTIYFFQKKKIINFLMSLALSIVELLIILLLTRLL